MTDKLRTLSEIKAEWMKQHPGKPFPGRAPAASAEQQQAVIEAIKARDQAAATATAPAYTGLDFQAMIDAYRDKRKCSYSDAYCAVLRTEAGRHAHRDFLKAKNPHISFEE